jgi:eukaryotic-like serine/threonine-protein kinase
MFSQLLSQPPIPLNAARPGLRFPAAVEAVIMRALSRDPAKRYTTVLEFAVELRDALTKAPPETNGKDEEGGGLLSKIKSLFR